MNEDRKKIWISQFQTGLFIRILSYWLIYQIAVWNFLFIWRVEQEGPGNPFEQYWNFFQGYSPTLLVFVLLVPFLAWDAVRFTHRVVGPIVRFRRALKDLIDGKTVRKLKLRKGDFLMDLQDDFNELLEVWEKRGVHVLNRGDALPSQEPSASVQS